jgi:cysteine desulfurase family protein (TIGR01976 family)
LAQTWKAGDEIILSHCDHDANVTPWALAAHDRGVTVRWIDIDPSTCALNLETLRDALSSRTRLVAVGMASNAVGTLHPVAKVAELAHAAGALVFLDAVHYAPHLLLDVPATDADFVVCSAYKFFGPHVGILWGKRPCLETITPYKVRPASNTLPDRWMTGTQNHEGIAGVGAAIDYLASLSSCGQSLRELLVSAYESMANHENRLGSHFLQGLAQIDGYRVIGHRSMQDRVSTFGILHEQLTARELSEKLAAQGIYSWAGNFYALPLTERLGLEPEGLLRIGFLHYNTIEEVDRVLMALREMNQSAP